MSWIDHVLAVDPIAPEPEELRAEDRERHGRFYTIAARLVRAGANVLPSVPGSKAPALRGWGDKPEGSLALAWGLANEHIALHSAGSPRMTEDHVRALAAQFREHNALWFPASAGLTVIDVDDITLLGRVLEACGETPFRVQSGRAGGGVHLIYSGVTRSKTGIVPGVDVKSSRGYAIAPGSIHASSGREYRSSPELLEALRRGSFEGVPELRTTWREDLKRVTRGLTRPTRLDLAVLSDSLRNDAKTREIGKALRAVANGKSPADFGDRDPTLYACLRTLAEHWPNAETDAIVALWQPVLDLWARDDEENDRAFDASGAEWCATKWERLVGEQEERVAAVDERDVMRRRAAWALVGEDRDDPCALGTEPLVVHKSRTYYIRIGSAWAGPHVREDIGPDMLASLRALYGLDTQDMTALMAAHGQPLREIRYSYTERTKLERGALVVQVAPLRALEPERSIDFDRAIDALAGEHAEALRQWLGGLVHLGAPCKALVLSGAPGLGKSLILDGLARLWVHGAAKLDQIVGKQFNAALTESPFAVADDEDSAQNGQALAKYIRSAVSARTQTFERKFHDTSRVDGSIRIAVGTNDPADFVAGAVSHRLNDASVEAFGQRLLHVPCQESARGWWGDDPARFVLGDEIAKHVLWLAERYRAPRGRFWVDDRSGDQTLTALVQLSTGLRGDLLVRIHEGGLGIERVGDTYYVRTSALVQTWTGSDRPRGLSMRTGGQALRALAHAAPGTPRISDAREHAISAALVDWYAERCGL